MRRYDAYASTALASTSTPAALQPNIIAVLSVVPRPHIGSKIEIGPLLERLIDASVTLINNRVNCSLVLPGYFGIVTRSSSKRSGVPTSIGSSRSSDRWKAA